MFGHWSKLPIVFAQCLVFPRPTTAVSGNSPMIWCFLSSILFDCYDELSNKATQSWPDHTHNMVFGMIGFVDDSNGQTNCFQEDETNQTLPDMCNKLKHNAQTWATLFGASGGHWSYQSALVILWYGRSQPKETRFLSMQSNRQTHPCK